MFYHIYLQGMHHNVYFLFRYIGIPKIWKFLLEIFIEIIFDASNFCHLKIDEIFLMEA